MYTLLLVDDEEDVIEVIERKAVSYTHLDVYKRQILLIKASSDLQGLCSPHLNWDKLNPVWERWCNDCLLYTSQEVSLNNMWGFALFRLWAPDSIHYISDVYKRQLIDRFGEPPKSVLSLLRVARLKALAHAVYLSLIHIFALVLETSVSTAKFVKACEDRLRI